MTRLHLVSETRRTQYGFTLVEIMISMVLAGIVMGAVYQLLIGQSRSYGKQRELMDVHETLRSAASLLAWELRQASAVRGDLYTINANSIVLRSVQGTGLVCVEHATLPRFGLWSTAGDIEATADDSALVVAGGNRWNVLKIQQVATAASLGVGNCSWPSTPAPDIAVELAVVNVPTDTAGIKVGAPFRAFRQVEYGLYQDAGDGRWWLGRKVGAAASYEKLTGPLLPQASGGLVLIYRDGAGNVTADPMRVRVIDFVLRAESYRGLRDAVDFQQDTLAIRVALRG